LRRDRLHDALAALFAWRHEVGRVLDDVSDPGVARLKLDWWRDEIRRGIDGAPRHPLSHALAPALDAHALPLAPFLEQTQQVERNSTPAHTRTMTPSDRPWRKTAAPCSS
jgi:phytoene/squalene synthetase